MEAHHRHHCRACGRVLKRHRGKRHHCKKSACRQYLQATGGGRTEQPSARYPLQTLAMSHRPTRD